MNPSGPLDSLQWVGFKNNNAGTVPAFGVMRVTGISVVEAGRTVLTCDQPNSYGDPGICVINGPVAVGTGLYGTCTRSGIIVALYDGSSGTPASGQYWGPVSSSWKMTLGSGGFYCMGASPNVGASIAIFTALPMISFRGQPTADVAAAASGTVNVYTGTFGSESQPFGSPSVSNVRNDSSCTVKGSKICTVVYVPDNGGWQFDQGKTS